MYQLVEMHNPKQQRHVHMKPTSKHKKMQINKQKIEKKAKQLRPTEIRNKTWAIYFKLKGQIQFYVLIFSNILMLVASSSAGNTNKYKKQNLLRTYFYTV